MSRNTSIFFIEGDKDFGIGPAAVQVKRQSEGKISLLIFTNEESSYSDIPTSRASAILCV